MGEGASAPRPPRGSTKGRRPVDKHWREKNRTVTNLAGWLDRQGHAGRLPRSLADRVCWWLDARYGTRSHEPSGVDPADHPAD